MVVNGSGFGISRGPAYRETYSVSFDDSMALKDRQLATLQCQNRYNNCSRSARIELQNCELLRANQYQIAYLSCLNQRGDDDEDHCRWLATMIPIAIVRIAVPMSK